MEQFKRAMYSTLFLAAALFGMIWYSIAAAIRLSIFVVLVVVVATPYLILKGGIEIGERSSGNARQPAIALGISASMGFAVLSPIILAVIVAYFLAAFLTAPVVGFKKGWSEGFVGIGKGGLAFLPLEVLIFHRQWSLTASDERETVDIQAAIDASNEQARVDALAPATQSQFNSLELTSNEFAALKAAHQMPLTEKERNMIRAIGNPTINESLDHYEERQRELKSANCPFLFDRPDPENTILLVKQYQLAGEWKAVPAGSWIMDRASLGKYCTSADYGKTENPNNRDNIMSPQRYEGNETRYRFHSFYPAQSQASTFFNPHSEGLSQELNQQVSFLRACISPTNTVFLDPVDSHSARLGM